MKISQLITSLEFLRTIHGDIEITALPGHPDKNWNEDVLSVDAVIAELMDGDKVIVLYPSDKNK